MDKLPMDLLCAWRLREEAIFKTIHPVVEELRRQHEEIECLQDVNKDLLEALNALVAAHGSILDLRESDELKMARAAIAKATGQ